MINLLQVPGGSESQQVLLQVRFAEVNRRVLQEVGVNFFLQKPRFSGRITTQQFSTAEFDDAGAAAAWSSAISSTCFSSIASSVSVPWSGRWNSAARFRASPSRT